MSRMPFRTKIAFGVFLLIALSALGVGLRYTLSPRIMSYHQEVLGLGWADLGPRERLLLLALMRGTGLCALITGMALTTLLLIPFRQGERWARWAVAGLSLTLLVPVAWEARVLALATGAATPWPPLVGAIVLVLIATWLATDPGRFSGHRRSPLSVLDRSDRDRYSRASIGSPGRVGEAPASALCDDPPQQTGPRRRTMQRKWMILAAAMVSMTGLTVGISVAEDEDSPLHKLMEQVNAKNLVITKGVRNAVGFKKSQKDVVASAEELAKLSKKAKEYGKDYTKKVKDVPNPEEKWNVLMDNFTHTSENLAKIAGKSGASQAEAKSAHTAVKKACTECHNVFRIEEEGF